MVATFWATFSKRLATFQWTFLAALSKAIQITRDKLQAVILSNITNIIWLKLTNRNLGYFSSILLFSLFTFDAYFRTG